MNDIVQKIISYTRVGSDQFSISITVARLTIDKEKKILN